MEVYGTNAVKFAGATGGDLFGDALILNVASWRWIFLMNVPLVIGCVSLILFAIPRSAPRDDLRRPMRCHFRYREIVGNEQ